MQENLVSLREIYLIRNGFSILKNISFDIKENENWVFLGGNGSGKTSLINLIFGYLWPTSGSIEVFGNKYGNSPLRPIQSKIGIVESSHQNNAIQKNLTVKEIISTGLIPSIGLYRELDLNEEQKLEGILIGNKWLKNPNQLFSTLSAGEKQKVLLLRALVNNPKLLILDEPCSALDIKAREDFLDLLECSIEKKTFASILITHRLEEIGKSYSHAMLLKLGEIQFIGKIKDTITSEKISNTFDYKVKVISSNFRFSIINE